MKKYSVIIPTMWKSNYLHTMLEIYKNSQYIDEIIIIDNDTTNRYNILENEKLKILTKNKNIYVNPAWNWGVKESSNENIVIANDDILINTEQLNKLFDIIDPILRDKIVIGPHESSFNSINEFTEIKLDNSVKNFTYGWGTFMILTKKSYVEIPESLLIAFGDNIQHSNNEPYKFIGVNIKTPMSTTLRSDSFLFNLALSDHEKIKHIKIKH